MPYKKSTVRRKRRPRKNKRRTGVNLMRSFPSTGLPNSVIMKHKYVQSATATTTTSAYSNMFRLNSLYDVDQTGLGHQPYYADQLSALYGRYRVYGVKVILRGTAGVNQTVIGFKAQPDTTAVTAIDQAMERPFAKYRLVNSGGPVGRLSQYFSISKLLGISKQSLMAEDNLAALVGNNPSSVYYLEVFAQHPDGASTTTFQYTVEFVFYTKWDQRIRVSQS